MYDNGKKEGLRFVDLFCGIRGFRIAAEMVCYERNIQPVCVFSSDIDPDAQKAYEANFGEMPAGDITKIYAQDIPYARFPFSGISLSAI